jgi:methyl-accepting chemotaxis protein
MTKLSNAARRPVEPDEDLEAEADAGKRIRFGIVGRTLVTMLLVGLVPLVLFGAVTLFQEQQRIRDDSELAMQANAERISSQVDEWVDKNVRVLQAASNLPAISSMQGDDQTRVLSAIQQAYPWMYLVFTVGPDGRNVARSDRKAPTDYSDRQYYKDAIGGKEVAWETLIGKTSKKPALILSVPIRVNGTVVGVLAAAMGIEDISKVIANWKAGKTGFAFLVDEKAKVVAHPREEFVLQEQVLGDHPLVSAFRSDKRPQLVSFAQTDGKDVLGYVRGSRFGWVVAVQQHEDELFASLRTKLTLGIVLLLCAGALVAVIALFSSRMLVRPVLARTEAADQMSLGELERPIALDRNDELGLLAQSLERLRKSMAAAMARLGH